MLDKSRGAVACSHCRALGQTPAVCPYCRRPICEACGRADDGEGCPAPRPLELRLGTGNRLLDLDESGRYGVVDHVLGNRTMVRLEDRAPLKPELRPRSYAGQDVSYRGDVAVAGDKLVLPAATYTVHSQGDRTWYEWHQGLLYVTPIVPGPVPRFIQIPTTDPVKQVLTTRDGRFVALVYEDAFVIVDLEERDDASVIRGERAAQLVRTKGELIHSLCIDSALGLVAVGLFGRVEIYSIEGARLRGSFRVDDDDVTCVNLGGSRGAAVAGKRLRVLQADAEAPPRTWRELRSEKLKLRGELDQREISLSHDGALLALRRKRKQVLVLDLGGGADQLIEAHTDRVCLVRFIEGGDRLVTADKDNRVSFWPRLEGRLVTGTSGT